jgi:cell division protein FtsW
LFGLGLGASRQKFSWLPAPHNDAIFAVLGEELGLAGCVFLLMLFGALAVRGYRIAMRAPDAFGTLVAVGITTWLIFQAMFNIGGVVTAIPFTGIPLPFISFGGSSLVVTMTAVGILLNISRQTRRVAESARETPARVEEHHEPPANTPPSHPPTRTPEGVRAFGRATQSEGGRQW